MADYENIAAELMKPNPGIGAINQRYQDIVSALEEHRSPPTLAGSLNQAMALLPPGIRGPPTWSGIGKNSLTSGFGPMGWGPVRFNTRAEAQAWAQQAMPSSKFMVQDLPQSSGGGVQLMVPRLQSTEPGMSILNDIVGGK